MNYKFILTIILLANTFLLNAQPNTVRINANILLPKDSIDSKVLISSLNGFLAAASKPNEDNSYVWATEKIETFILLDEVSGIGKSSKFKDNFFYKPYLMNVVPTADSGYFVQVAYIGVGNDVPMLRANFDFVAHRSGDSFLFSSPLVSNTKNWKTKTVGRNIFHYQNSINTDKAKRYTELAAAFDKKLKSANEVTEFYCCDNITELQKLIGVTYKADYNGRTESVWSSKTGNKKLMVLGNKNGSFNDFDEHDLWHERLGMVIPRSQVNNPVDEGCAYLYGGSWGLPWSAIFKAFNEQVADSKDVNWAQLKETPVYFKTKGIDNNADNVINALLVQKIEKEHGFAGVWELLNCGKAEKGNERYYAVLERLTGITKASYNEQCRALVVNERKRLKV